MALRKVSASCATISPSMAFSPRPTRPTGSRPYRCTARQAVARVHGSVADFFTHPAMVNKYRDVAALVRNGGATDHTLAPNDTIWVEFARSMAPMFALPASIAAPHITIPGKPAKVLDIAAGSRPVRHPRCTPQSRRPNYLPGLGQRPRRRTSECGGNGHHRPFSHHPRQRFRRRLRYRLRRCAPAQLSTPLRCPHQRNLA